METPLQTASRLLTALVELVGQAGVCIRTMDFVEAVEIQERAAPLVERLCDLADHPEVQALRPRVIGLLERYEQNHHFLDTQLARLQEELGRINGARGRLRRMAPAYARGNPAGLAARLNTAA